MSDAAIASKIFRHQLKKAPRGPYSGGATLGSTDLPATPSADRIGYCRVNPSSVTPVRPVIFVGEAALLKPYPGHGPALAQYAVYDPAVNAIHDAATAFGQCDFAVAGLGGIGPDVLFVAHHQPWKELFLPAIRRTGTLQLPTFSNVVHSFTVDDHALTEPASIWHQFWQLMTASKLPYAKDLARRISQIQHLLAEDEEDEVSLSPLSLHHLISFLEESKTGRPQLAPTPTGYLIARWISQGRKMTIHFYPDGRAEYYHVSPNPMHANMQDMDSSSTTADALVAKLTPLGVLAWMKAV